MPAWKSATQQVWKPALRIAVEPTLKILAAHDDSDVLQCKDAMPQKITAARRKSRPTRPIHYRQFSNDDFLF